MNLAAIVIPKAGNAYVQRIEKGNAVSFIGALEWIRMSYPSYERIHAYVDNAPWHKSEIVRIYQSMTPRIIVEYLPKYSPRLNPVEWEWHELRRTTTHTVRFQSSEECFQAISIHFESRIGKNTMYRQVS